jgi:hypothetical protein
MSGNAKGALARILILALGFAVPPAMADLYDTPVSIRGGMSCELGFYGGTPASSRCGA